VHTCSLTTGLEEGPLDTGVGPRKYCLCEQCKKWNGMRCSKSIVESKVLYSSVRAISWTLYNKYFEKIFSALCVDVFPELFQIFPNFDIPWYMTKDSEVHFKNCLLIQTCSTSWFSYSMVGLVDRVFTSYTGGQWIKSLWMRPYFLYCNKTSEYSEIYRQQLTSEHFLLYNYRSSTLWGISWNISRLLRQCSAVLVFMPVACTQI
jgi:hypothetical protein